MIYPRYKENVPLYWYWFTLKIVERIQLHWYWFTLRIFPFTSSLKIFYASLRILYFFFHWFIPFVILWVNIWVLKHILCFVYGLRWVWGRGQRRRRRTRREWRRRLSFIFCRLKIFLGQGLYFKFAGAHFRNKEYYFWSKILH